MPANYATPFAALLAGLTLAACATSAVTTEHPVTVDGKTYTIIKTDYTSSVSDEVDYKVVIGDKIFDCATSDHCYEIIRQQTAAPRKPKPKLAAPKPRPRQPALIPLKKSPSGTIEAPKFDGAD